MCAILEIRNSSISMNEKKVADELETTIYVYKHEAYEHDLLLSIKFWMIAYLHRKKKI